MKPWDDHIGIAGRKSREDSAAALRTSPPTASARSWGRGESYNVFQYQGHDVLAVPAGSKSAALEGVRRFHAHTKKRKIYRAAISGLVRLGASSLLAANRHRMIAADFLFDIDAWGEELQRGLGRRIAHLTLSWPAEPSRRRLYIHALDAELRAIGFVKVAFRADHHAKLAIEAQALTDLRTCGLKHVRVPELLGRGRFGGASYLVLEPLPNEVRPLKIAQESNTAALRSEYCGPPMALTLAQIKALSWWPAYLESLQPEHHVFHAELLALLPLGAEVCRAHGDLGLANMLTDGERTWIFDWESHHVSAPILTDSVSFFLSFDVSRAAQRRAPRVAQLKERFRSDTPERRLAVMLAIAYRHACDIPDAGNMMTAWNENPR